MPQLLGYGLGVNFWIPRSGNALLALLDESIDLINGTPGSGVESGDITESLSGGTAYNPLTFVQGGANVLARSQINLGAPGYTNVDGVWVESGRTNKYLQSRTLDDAAWTLANANAFGSGSLTGQPDPAGGNTAFFIQENSATAAHGIHTSADPLLADGVIHCTSILAKAGTRNWFRISAISNCHAWFDLATGTLGTGSGVPYISHSIFRDPSWAAGWYLCSVVFLDGGGVDTRCYIRMQTADNQFTYTGDGSSGLYLWHCQNEAGRFPTSIIPTAGATVTRNKGGHKTVLTGLPTGGLDQEGTVVTFFRPAFWEEYTAGQFSYLLDAGDLGGGLTIGTVAQFNVKGELAAYRNSVADFRLEQFTNAALWDNQPLKMVSIVWADDLLQLWENDTLRGEDATAVGAWDLVTAVMNGAAVGTSVNPQDNVSQCNGFVHSRFWPRRLTPPEMTLLANSGFALVP